MFKALTWIGLVFLLASCAGEEDSAATSPPAAPPAPAAPAFTDKQLDQALASIRSENEKTIRDAFWMSRTMPSLYVGVDSDGSNRNGFAEYLCTELSARGINGALVKIVDITDVVQKDEFTELGKAICPR